MYIQTKPPMPSAARRRGDGPLTLTPYGSGEDKSPPPRLRNIRPSRDHLQSRNVRTRRGHLSQVQKDSSRNVRGAGSSGTQVHPRHEVIWTPRYIHVVTRSSGAIAIYRCKPGQAMEPGHGFRRTRGQPCATEGRQAKDSHEWPELRGTKPRPQPGRCHGRAPPVA